MQHATIRTGRKTNDEYDVLTYDWCIAEWPDYVLARSMCWATLTLLRCAIVDTIPGGLSFVFSKLLLLFSGLATGILLPGASGTFMFVAKFAGVLADLVGHQTLTAWKGPSAVRSCVSCANLTGRKRGPESPAEVGLAEHDESRFIQSTNAEVFLIVDNLAKLKDDGCAPTRFRQVETEVGFNHEPLGVLQDKEARRIYRPVEHQLTDWMHTWCQDGVASSEVALLLGRLENHRPPITNDMVQTFVGECVLPIEHGKIKGEWVEAKRLRGNSLTAFSSMVLSIVPCVALLLDWYKVADQLPEEVECFLMLTQILGILSLGPRRAMKFVDRLKALTIEHHRLFVKLYSQHVKPKLHHTHHVITSMVLLGFLLACFVTERKHKAVKQFAINTCRHFEHTTLLDCLHQQCEYLSSGHDLFEAEFLVHPHVVAGRGDLRTSTAAVCHAGTLHARDICCTQDGVVGKIESFWRHGAGPVLARVQSYACVRNQCSVRDTRQVTAVVVELSQVLCPCIWFPCREHIIKVHLPASLYL